MKKSRMVLLLAVIGLLLIAAPAHAVLRSFATTGAVMPPDSGSPGVPVGAPPGVLPAWYQDINGVSVQPCLSKATCGLIGLGDPMFNEALSLSYPTNFPSEAFYTDAVALFTLAPSPVDVRVVLAMEYTFINATTGALIVAPPRPANALAAPFQRHRLILSYPPGVPVPGTVGNFTITHPWGVTTFPANSAKCVNNAGGQKCSMTIDMPIVGAIPPSFAAALGVDTVNPRVNSQSTFLKDPAAPAGFLGTGAAAASFTGAVAGSANSITVTDPLGNTGTASSLSLLVGQLLGLTAAPQTVTFPASRPSVTSAPITVTITNPSAVSPAIIAPPAITGANALDFTLLPGAPADCLGAGANLGPAGTCTFGVQFFEAAPGVNGTKSAVVSFPVTTPLSMPPVTINLAGTIDSIAPTATSLPAPGEPNWPANNRPHITFSEPVTGVSGTTFTITGPGGVDVGGTVTLDATGKIADYAQPAGEFVPGATYTGTLTTAITDIAGNPLQATAAIPAGQNFVFTFTAGQAVTTPPSVISTEPLDNSTGARVTDPITVTFAGSVDPNTINATTFFLSDGVTGTVTYDSATRTAILKPDAPGLDFFHTYTATVKGGANGVKSLGQIPMAADFTWQFLTNGAPGAPSLYLPVDGATDIGTTVDFQWVKSKDNDGEPVTYHLYYCTNPGFLGCPPVDVAGTSTTAGSPLRNSLAGLGGYGAGMLLAGFAIVGGVRFRRKMFFLIAVLAISGMVAAACTKTNTVTATPDPATLMTKSVSDLRSGTTYWWKVTADDGNGALIDSEKRSFTTQ